MDVPSGFRFIIRASLLFLLDGWIQRRRQIHLTDELTTTDNKQIDDALEMVESGLCNERIWRAEPSWAKDLKVDNTSRLDEA